MGREREPQDRGHETEVENLRSEEIGQKRKVLHICTGWGDQSWT
jgi:hypothetical protein